MTKTKALLFAVLLLVGLGFGLARAQTSTTAIDVAGVPAITLTVDGVVAVCSNADVSGNGTKRVAIVGAELDSGHAVHLGVRIQRASNGLFIDIVTGSSLANLDTRFGAMSLTGISHPSPTEDAIDTAALVDAAD